MYDRFKKVIDGTYNSVKRKIPDIKYPCYGGRLYRFFISVHDEYLYFYLTEDSLIYTSNGVLINAIPFKDIKKLSVKRGAVIKYRFRIRLATGRKFHFYLYCNEKHSTALTGSASDNVRQFIDTLLASVNVD